MSCSTSPLFPTRGIAAATLLGASLLSGCAGLPGLGGGSTAGSASTPAPRPVQICNAAQAQSFVGKTNTASTLEAARKQAGAYMARVLREGQAVTQEFNQERLNLVVDGAGKITAVRCG
ncbi:I78 family peptidase inhibitor [Comamonas composti]|uniref:I78 family peptidase inhibitor n=1 Tax=Comamonas composti TaxID=408558 RepID=UPI00047EA0B8|nr:I78 family peptidase inhibitor [Comamonas composti]